MKPAKKREAWVVEGFDGRRAWMNCVHDTRQGAENCAGAASPANGFRVVRYVPAKKAKRRGR